MKRNFTFTRTRIYLSSPVHLDSLAYEIRQGTIEQNEAEREWVLAHYARTSKKRSVLSGSGGPSAAPNTTSHPNKKVKR